MRRFMVTFVALMGLSACEGRVDLTFADDATISARSAMILEQEACDLLLADGIEMCVQDGQESKGQNPLVYDADSGTYRNDVEIIAPGSDFEELVRMGGTFAHDPDQREVSWTLPVTLLSNMADGPARDLSGGDGEGMPAELKTLFDGKTVTFSVRAAEILDSNGVISSDRTEVQFSLPAAYVYSGEGTPELTEFYMHLKY